MGKKKRRGSPVPPPTSKREKSSNDTASNSLPILTAVQQILRKFSQHTDDKSRLGLLAEFFLLITRNVEQRVDFASLSSNLNRFMRLEGPFQNVPSLVNMAIWKLGAQPKTATAIPPEYEHLLAAAYFVRNISPSLRRMELVIPYMRALCLIAPDLFLLSAPLLVPHLQLDAIVTLTELTLSRQFLVPALIAAYKKRMRKPMLLQLYRRCYQGETL